MNDTIRPILTFSGARLAFRARGRQINALNGVSAAIAAGEVTCIVGPNGAGKTTLLKTAAGLIALDSGVCALLDRPIRDWPRGDLARRIAYLPQGGESAWPLTAREIVALGRLPHGGTLARESFADAEAIDKALARADVAHLASRRVDQLSAGERARVLFARALATGADVLLADEPAAHLDPAHQLRLIDLLSEEARRGAAVLVTLHELPLAARCDRVLVLNRGCIAAGGPPDIALGDGVLGEVFGVAAARAPIPHGPPVPVPFRLV